MKKELIKYLIERADQRYADTFCIEDIAYWVGDFFDQYQPERSKREDFAKEKKAIDRALDSAFNEKLDQESYDILLEVCRFAKMRCSELYGDIERDK